MGPQSLWGWLCFQGFSLKQAELGDSAWDKTIRIEHPWVILGRQFEGCMGTRGKPEPEPGHGARREIGSLT